LGDTAPAAPPNLSWNCVEGAAKSGLSVQYFCIIPTQKNNKIEMKRFSLLISRLSSTSIFNLDCKALSNRINCLKMDDGLKSEIWYIISLLRQLNNKIKLG